MKLLAVIFCLFSINAFAQSSNAAHTDTAKKILIIDAAPLRKSHALIIVDDRIYKGKLKSIDPKSIRNVTVLKGKDAIPYGPKAANGVIIIRTEWYKNIDTIADVKSLDSVADKNAVYIIDGTVSENKLSGIDPNNILSIMLFKKTASDSFYINKASHGAVVIITKQGATEAYQKKFSALSSKYKEYLESHNNDDSHFLYLIDGSSLEQIYIDYNPANTDKTWSGIRKFSDIPKEKIKKVSFLNNNGPAIGKKIIVIKTKKD